jgi:hypothetical protein
MAWALLIPCRCAITYSGLGNEVPGRHPNIIKKLNTWDYVVVQS